MIYNEIQCNAHLQTSFSHPEKWKAKIAKIKRKNFQNLKYFWVRQKNALIFYFNRCSFVIRY